MSDDDPGVGLVAGRVPVLRSGRILLRPLARDDAPRIQALLDDFDVVRWMSRIPFPYGVSDALHFIEGVAPSEVSWAVDAAGEGLAGIGGFAFRPDRSDVELGYWLGRPFWGRGYATEAARLMLGHAWDAGARRVLSGCFEGNARSQRVLEKCGFRVVGRSARFSLARGADLPHVDMAMDRPA